MRVNWFYIFVAFTFCGMLFLTFRFFKGSGHSSVGVAVSNAYTVSTDKAALVTGVKVAPGQEIKAGQLLVELSSVELEMEIEKMEQRISVLKMEQREKTKLAITEAALVKAQSGVEIAELNTEIIETESELKLNREITKVHQLGRDSAADSPIEEKIGSLKQQRSRHEEASAIQVRDIMQESETEQVLLGNQITILQKELDLLYDQKNKLNKYASSDGVVETIFVKPGEQVNAFGTLISLNPVHPSSVVGYLVGKKQSMPIGSAVSISSYEYPRNVTDGKIIGYGAVVQLPEILQKATATKAFGREVFIEIKSQNKLSAGEKVLIR
jgi:multidrug resistance efflux pump